MSVAKVIEVIGQGKTIEDAMKAALDGAKKSVHNIRHIDVEHIHAEVENNQIAFYRVITKISFVVEE